MSEHIRNDIGIGQNGSVGGIDRERSPFWNNNGAVMGKPRHTGPVLLASEPKPRRMLQPLKDELRRQLEVAQAEAAYWRGMFENLRDDPNPERRAASAGLIVGLVVGALVGWALA